MIFARRPTPFYIAAIYLLVGGLWILFSDELLAFLVKNSAILRQLQLLKDGFYLIVTAGLLYALSNRLLASQRQQAAPPLSEGKFRQLTENIREVFWLMSLNPSEVIYVSPTYESVWCRTCESLYKQPMSWIEAVHPMTANRYLLLLRGVTDRKEIVTKSIGLCSQMGRFVGFAIAPFPFANKPDKLIASQVSRRTSPIASN
jgi:hypothetical protein